jgi:hypothetical protein
MVAALAHAAVVLAYALGQGETVRGESSKLDTICMGKIFS